MNTDKIYAESIVNEYSVKNTSKVVALKKLDQKVKLPPIIFTFSLGIFSAIILGVGMCLSMKIIGEGVIMIIIGIIIGIIGIIGCAINYPIYRTMRHKRMNKYANDILLLAKDITEEK